MDEKIIPQTDHRKQHEDAGHHISWTGCGGWKCEQCHGSGPLFEKEKREFENDPQAVAEYNAWADSLVFEDKAEE